MQGRKRTVANPLALAVLSCLRERPMHPYEMATTMRSRGKERSIKLNYGSLYTVVDNLSRHGFIEAALSELAVLAPGHATALLAERVAVLEKTLADERAEVASYPWLPRLLTLEAEYHLAMRDDDGPGQREGGRQPRLTRSARRPPARCGNTRPEAMTPEPVPRERDQIE